MFRKEGKGSRKGSGAHHSRRYQPAHSKESRLSPEEQEELLQPLNTGMMEALVDKNGQASHAVPADPFEPVTAPGAYEPEAWGESEGEIPDAPEPEAASDDALAPESSGALSGEDWALPEQQDDAKAAHARDENAPLKHVDGDAAFEMPAAEGGEPEPADAWEAAQLPDAEPEAVPEPEPASVSETASASEPTPEGAPVRTMQAQDADEQDVNPIELSRYQRGGDQYTHRKSRRARRKRLLVGAVACVAAVFLVCGGLAFAWWNGMANSIALGDRSIEEELKDPVVSEPYWTLILGSDSRENTQNGSRSDVIILARIDQAAKKVTLVSIPRDTKVTINGQTMKINAAYGVGGATQAIQTIEEYAGIEISHYVEIYFDGFSDLVDKLGGVTVDVPERASYAGVTIEPGLQTLDGKQALTLARNRKTYTDGDFTRTECQRLLVQALVSKVLQQDVTQIPDTINAIAGCFSTDIPLQDLIALATSMQGMGSDSIYMAMAPSTTGMIGSASYTFTYIDQWKLIMQKAKNGEDPTLTDEEIEICGDASTRDYDLDMSEPIDEETMTALEEYWTEQAEKALEEQQKQLEGQQKDGTGEAGSSGSSASS